MYVLRRAWLLSLSLLRGCLRPWHYKQLSSTRDAQLLSGKSPRKARGGFPRQTTEQRRPGRCLPPSEGPKQSRTRFSWQGMGHRHSPLTLRCRSINICREFQLHSIWHQLIWAVEPSVLNWKKQVQKSHSQALDSRVIQDNSNNFHAVFCQITKSLRHNKLYRSRF